MFIPGEWPPYLDLVRLACATGEWWCETNVMACIDAGKRVGVELGCKGRVSAYIEGRQNGSGVEGSLYPMCSSYLQLPTAGSSSTRTNSRGRHNSTIWAV
jgi:hypothetical protein